MGHDACSMVITRALLLRQLPKQRAPVSQNSCTVSQHVRLVWFVLVMVTLFCFLILTYPMLNTDA